MRGYAPGHLETDMYRFPLPAHPESASGDAEKPITAQALAEPDEQMTGA